MADTESTAPAIDSDVVLHYDDEDIVSQNEREEFLTVSDNVELSMHHEDQSGFGEEVEAHYKSKDASDFNNRSGKRHRGSDEDFDSKREFSSSGAAKRAKSAYGNEKYELRLLIPVNTAGALIGKGGSNIREMRSEFNGNIQLPDSEGYERIVTAVTQDLESLAKFAGKASQCLHERMKAYEEQSLRLLIHKSQAGTIIGVKGTRIKEIREKSGAKIKVNQECCPRSTDRVCLVSGPSDAIVKAVEAIVASLKTAPPKGYVEHYDPSYCDDSYNYGGFNSFDPACPFDKHAPESHAPDFGRMPPFKSRQKVPPNRFDGQFEDSRRRRMGGSGSGMASHGRVQYPPDRTMRRGLTLGGLGPMRRANRHTYNDYRSDDYESHRYDHYDHVDHSGGYGDFEDGCSSRSNSRFDSSRRYKDSFADSRKGSTQVTIPTILAGSIIGVRGERIRQIRHDCGADIRIEEELPGTKERVITIIGNEEQIQNAQYLLQKSVKLYSGEQF